MSNQVSIIPTEFKNVRTGNSTFGIRVYDDHCQAYDNTWDWIPDDNLDVLRKVLESDDITIRETLSFVEETEKGINIGDQWYDWDEIKECFDGR